MSKIRIGLPSKGRLKDESINFFSGKKKSLKIFLVHKKKRTPPQKKGLTTIDMIFVASALKRSESLHSKNEV